MTHTPTRWGANPENWLNVEDDASNWHKALICQVNGKKRPEAEANRDRIVACVNFFHGRDIPTENIPEGGIGDVVDVLRSAANLGHIQARDLLAKLGVDQ